MKLAEVTEILPTVGPVHAYETLVHGARHIPGIKTAFGTKYLYFVGYEPGARESMAARPTSLSGSCSASVRRTGWP